MKLIELFLSSHYIPYLWLMLMGAIYYQPRKKNQHPLAFLQLQACDFYFADLHSAPNMQKSPFTSIRGQITFFPSIISNHTLTMTSFWFSENSLIEKNNVVLGLSSCGCHLFSAMSSVEHWRKGVCFLAAYSAKKNATPNTWKVQGQSQQEELSLAFAQDNFPEGKSGNTLECIFSFHAM